MHIDKTKTKIRELKNSDLTIINEFITYEPELKKFLIEDAIANQKIGISRTY